MTYLSPSFIFVFLPVAMAIYAMAPRLRRIDLLPMISSVFFVCVNMHDPLSLVYYFLISICSAAAIKIYKKTKKRAVIMLLGILATIAAIASLTYRFMLGGAAVYHVGLIVSLAAVISMSFDILQNQGRVPDTAWEALVYVTFFPVMPAGPFVRYGDLIEKLDGIEFSTENFLKGILRFIVGFIKCVAVSALLGRVYDDTMALEGSFGLAVYVLLAAICGVRIYTFFSGYSDMGRGIALMLGIDIKKDFGDPFINSSPVNYMKRFFRSLSEFCKLYVVSPIVRLFGSPRKGRAAACIASGAFYAFLVCKTPEMALVLLVPFIMISYFLMFRSRAKRREKPMIVRIAGTGVTFVLTSAAWILISLGSLSEIHEAVAYALKNPVFYAEYRVLTILSNVESIVVPVIVGTLVFISSKLLSLESIEGDGEISVKTMVLRSVAMTVLAVIFILSVVLLLPQFPDVVSYANVFRFV